MFGLYILILVGCVALGFVAAGCFGNKLYDKAEDIKGIYTKDENEEGEESNE